MSLKVLKRPDNVMKSINPKSVSNQARKVKVFQPEDLQKKYWDQVNAK